MDKQLIIILAPNEPRYVKPRYIATNSFKTLVKSVESLLAVQSPQQTVDGTHAVYKSAAQPRSAVYSEDSLVGRQNVQIGEKKLNKDFTQVHNLIST